MTSSPQSASRAVNDELVSILRDDLDLKCGSVATTTRLVDDLGMDSVAFAVALVAIEDRFGVQLSEEDLLTCKTVGDLQHAIYMRASA
jgi:acyl carrier protein